MTIFKKPFRPAKNRQGLSKLTYKNAEMISGIKTDNQGNEKAYEFIKLNFSCMGMDRSINQALSINLSPNLDVFDTESYGAKVLLNMGLALPEEDEIVAETELDEDGFVMDKIEVSDDGFSAEDSDYDGYSALIEDFLKSCQRQEFLAFVAKNSKGFWEVDVDSLKPFK